MAETLNYTGTTRFGDSSTGACHILSTTLPVAGAIPDKNGIITTSRGGAVTPMPLLVECLGPNCPFRMWDADRQDCHQRPRSKAEDDKKTASVMAAYLTMMKEITGFEFSPAPKDPNQTEIKLPDLEKG